MSKIKKDFTGIKVFAGIDAHSVSHQLSIFVNDTFYKSVRMPATNHNIINYLHKNFPGADFLFRYEAGFCGFGLHYDLLENGIKNIVVHAADIPISHKHREQKSDKVDSKLIAQCLMGQQLIGIFVPDQQQVALRNLVRLRDQVVTDLNRCRCRIKMKLHFLSITIPEELKGSRWTKKFISWLQSISGLCEMNKYTLDFQISDMLHIREKLLTINRKLRELSRSQEYEAVYNLLISAPGIGMVGAWRIISEIGDMTRFQSEKQICSYAGLIPNSKASGENHYAGRITVRGNKLLRTTFIEAAHIARRNDPALAAFYQKTNQRKTKSNTAIVAVARKLLCRIRHMMINSCLYEKGVA